MKTLNQENLWDYHSLHTDYKTEVIAFNIWKYHPAIDDVFLRRLGSNNRSFNKDLKGIKRECSDEIEEVISVESYREGIYDYLPEGIFHPPSFKYAQKNIADVVDQIRQEKIVEQKARTFFRPFELETFFCHLKTLELAASFDGLDKQNYFFDLLEELWPFFKLLTSENKKIFAYLLPVFHRARGKKVWIEKCLNTCFKIPVDICFTPNKITALDERSPSLILGDMYMGVNFILIGDHFDGEMNWKFELGPIPYDDLHLYREGAPFRVLLQGIYECCLPIAVSAEVVVVTRRNEHSFTIENNNNSLLGYSTYL